MTEQEKYQKTDEIVSKFKNGRSRYQSSALFNTTVQMLVRDVDIYEVIDALIMAAEDSTQALQQYMLELLRLDLIQKI